MYLISRANDSVGEELFVGLVAGAAEVGGQGGLEGAQVKGGDVGGGDSQGPE